MKIKLEISEKQAAIATSTYLNENVTEDDIKCGAVSKEIIEKSLLHLIDLKK